MPLSGKSADASTTVAPMTGWLSASRACPDTVAASARGFPQVVSGRQMEQTHPVLVQKQVLDGEIAVRRYCRGQILSEAAAVFGAAHHEDPRAKLRRRFGAVDNHLPA